MNNQTLNIPYPLIEDAEKAFNIAVEEYKQIIEQLRQAADNLNTMSLVGNAGKSAYDYINDIGHDLTDLTRWAENLERDLDEIVRDWKESLDPGQAKTLTDNR